MGEMLKHGSGSSGGSATVGSRVWRLLNGAFVATVVGGLVVMVVTGQWRGPFRSQDGVSMPQAESTAGQSSPPSVRQSLPTFMVRPTPRQNLETSATDS